MNVLITPSRQIESLSIRYFLSFAIFIFIILESVSINAQANALVMGQIQGHNKLVKTVELHINNRYINNEIEVYESNLLSDGTFAFAVEVNEPQYATISYSRNKSMIYLEPNDTLNIISSNADSFPFSLNFSGKGGDQNRYIYKYLEKNPKELNAFKMIQYKKGTYWFRLDPATDKMMKNNHPEAFKKKMLLRKEQALLDLDFNVANNSGKFSPAFKEFMSTEIIYDWAYHLLLYGSVFKNKHGLTESYFSFLNEVPIQNESVGNYRYRDFLMAYLNYKATKNNAKVEFPFLRQYEQATNLLSGRAQAFAQSELIYKSFGKGQIDELLAQYWTFVKETDHPEFNDKVVVIYEKAIKQTAGAPAPDFKLTDDQGRKVTLDSYNGQVVFLNFWASWCRPCMAKMNMMQAIESELKSKGIVFMNVSLDRNQEDWKRAIANGNFGGVHLIAEGDIDSGIANDYQVRILPQYFLINKQGNFAEKPTQFKHSDIKMVLNRLSK